MKAPTSIHTFLVERRNLLLGFMLAVAVLCGLMVPRVNVNTDMTRYLPADSEMKQGLDRMTQALGPNTIDMLSVRAMYQGLTAFQRDSLAAVFRQMEDVRALDFSRLKRLGVTAGASTPEDFLRRVVEELRK